MLSKLKTEVSSIRKLSNLFQILKIVVTILGTSALFYKDLFAVFSDAWQSEVTSHILLVPLIFVYLIYRKRNMLRAVLPLQNNEKQSWIRYGPTIVAILLVAIAILLYWYGSFTFTPLEYHLFALPIFVSGSLLLLFNFQTLRQLVFPLLFLFFLVPPPSEFLFSVGATLSTLSALISTSISNVFGIPSVLISEYGNPMIQITRPNGTLLNFTVDIACSGIYSLIGFLIIVTLLAYIIRDKLWKKIVLILTGIPIIYLFNVFRITLILIIGYNYGDTIALEVFHLIGSWILMPMGTLLLLFISEKVFRTQIFSKIKKCPQCLLKPQTTQIFCFACNRILTHKVVKINKTDIFKIIVLIFTVVLMVSIQAPVFALTQKPVEVLVTTPAGQQISTEVLPSIPGYVLQFEYRDTDFEKLAKIDAAIVYLYVPLNHTQKPIWVAIEISSVRSMLHRWESCLINYPMQQGSKPKVTQIDLHDITLSENPLILSRFFAFQNTQTGKLQTVLYWYESASFNVNSTIQQKYFKISLIMYPNNIEEKSQNQDQSLQMANSILTYWQPIQVWSPLALVLSQNGGQLTVITIISLLITLAFYRIEVRKQKQLNKIVYLKLSPANRLLIDTIRLTAKKNILTLENIADTYYKITGQFKDKTELFYEITELENIGLIKNAIISIRDEPIQTWET